MKRTVSLNKKCEPGEHRRTLDAEPHHEMFVYCVLEGNRPIRGCQK